MFVLRKVWATVASLMILLAACESSGIANKKSSPAEPPFRSAGADWRPFSPSFITFRHVEDDTTAGASTKTFIRTEEAEKFSKMFGNILLDAEEPGVASLIGFPSPLSMLIVRSGDLVRLNTPEAVERALRNEWSRYKGHEEEKGPAMAEVLLFPRADQFERYLAVLSADQSGPITTMKQLAPGCVLANRTKLASNGEQIVLAMHVPDDAVSWSDPQDRTCLVAFLSEVFGAQPDALQSLLPAVRKDEECNFAQILRSGKPRIFSAFDSIDFNSPRYTARYCPAAPIKRAASLVWYAEQHGVGLDDKGSAYLIKRVIPTCIDHNPCAHLRCPMVIMRQG